jgi:signal transduction histidine kinase
VRRRAQLGICALGFLAAAGSFVLVATSHQLNVGKHAGGGVEARIFIRERPDRLEFEIRDDGQGFGHRVGAAEGRGLTNMQERLAALGGTLEVESAPGGGTRVRGGVPLGADRRRPVGGVVGLESESSTVSGTR